VSECTFFLFLLYKGDHKKRVEKALQLEERSRRCWLVLRRKREIPEYQQPQSTSRNSRASKFCEPGKPGNSCDIGTSWKQENL
jgi:hypothetical protein